MKTREEAYTLASDKAELKYPEADTANFNHRMLNMEVFENRKHYIQGFMDCYDKMQIEPLTTNQLIALLEVQRGYFVNGKEPSLFDDLQVLIQRGLCIWPNSDSYQLTAKGEMYINLIKDKIKF